MKQILQKVFVTTLLLLSWTCWTHAYDFKVGSIYYNIINAEDKKVEVTNNGEASYAAFVKIPATVTYDGVTYSVTSIGTKAFQNCTELEQISISEGIVSVKDLAFMGCSSLEEIHFPNSVQTIGNQIFGNSGMKKIYLGNGIVSVGVQETAYYSQPTTEVYVDNLSIWCKINFVWEDNFPCNALGNISHLYCDGKEIEDLIIPDDINKVNASAFYKLPIKSVTIGANVKTIGDFAFSGCENLKEITWSNNLTRIGFRSFYECTSLTSLNLPEGITSIGSEAFGYCSGITSITLPQTLQAIEGGAFEGTAIRSITIPNSVTKLGIYHQRENEIESGIFSGCEYLGLGGKVIIPNSVTSMGDQLFLDCPYNQEPALSNQCDTIPNDIFKRNSFMTAIRIPSNVKYIADGAFQQCASLCNIYCYAKTPPTMSFHTFYQTSTENITLHVLKGYKDTYANQSYYSDFGSIVDDLELPEVKSVSFTEDSYSLDINESVNLLVKSNNPDFDRYCSKLYEFSTDDSDILYVSKKSNTMTGLSEGWATVTVQVPGTDVKSTVKVYVRSEGEAIEKKLNAYGLATFSWDTPVEFISGAQPYTVQFGEDNTLVCEKIEDNYVPAYNGVLLKGEEANAIARFEEVASKSIDALNNDLLPTTTPTPKLKEFAYVLSDNEFVRFTGDAFTPNRAYLPYHFGYNSESPCKMIFVDDATQIQEVNTNNESTKTSKRIINGKLVIKKGKMQYFVDGTRIK